MLVGPDAVTGERARVRVRKARRRYGEADLVDVLVPSPDRVPAECPYIPRCGGCRLQHVRYEATLEAKRGQVREHLARICHLHDVDVRPAVAAVRTRGYRHKME